VRTLELGLAVLAAVRLAARSSMISLSELVDALGHTSSRSPTASPPVLASCIRVLKGPQNATLGGE